MTGEIRVIEYMGLSGGFASSSTVRHRVELVNHETKASKCLTGHWGESMSQATRMASEWKHLLGWPINFYRESVETRRSVEFVPVENKSS